MPKLGDTIIWNESKTIGEVKYKVIRTLPDGFIGEVISKIETFNLFGERYIPKNEVIERDNKYYWIVKSY